MNFLESLTAAFAGLRERLGRKERGSIADRWLSAGLTLLPFIGLGLVLALIGWPQSAEGTRLLLGISRCVAGAFGLLVWLRWTWIEGPHWDSWRGYLFGPGLALVIIATAVFEERIGGLLAGNGHPVHIWLVGLAALQQLLVFLSRFGDWLPFFERSFLSRSSPGVILVFTFTVLIVAGCLLLKMPNATTDGIS